MDPDSRLTDRNRTASPSSSAYTIGGGRPLWRDEKNRLNILRCQPRTLYPHSSSAKSQMIWRKKACLRPTPPPPLRETPQALKRNNKNVMRHERRPCSMSFSSCWRWESPYSLGHLLFIGTDPRFSPPASVQRSRQLGGPLGGWELLHSVGLSILLSAPHAFFLTWINRSGLSRPPQLWKNYRSKSCEGLSPWTFGIVMTENSAYAAVSPDPPPSGEWQQPAGFSGHWLTRE